MVPAESPVAMARATARDSDGTQRIEDGLNPADCATFTPPQESQRSISITESAGTQLVSGANTIEARSDGLNSSGHGQQQKAS